MELFKIVFDATIRKTEAICRHDMNTAPRYELTQLEDEAIVLVKHYGHLTAEHMRKTRQEVTDYINALPEPIAVITDFEDAESGLADVIALITQDRAHGTPTVTVRRTSIFVGTNPLIRMYSQAMRKLPFGDYGFIVCKDMDKALAFARDYLRIRDA